MTQTRNIATLCAAIAITALGCGNPDHVSIGDGERQIVGTVLPEPVEQVDVLFVIDTSFSMTQEQDALAQWIPEFFGVLEDGGELPSLHIGIVSSDVGAAPGVGGCDGNGDNGVLQNQPQDACEGPTGQFISDILNPDGTRTQNFTGTLNDTFSCIAPLGNLGCGFEQPLESMERALDGSNPENAGFLREDALLVVVFVTDEDDCSAKDYGLFDPNDPALGPLSSFRCFAEGVVCDEADLSAPGAKTNCTAREDSAYVAGIQPYVEFLQSVKTNPAKIVVAHISGQNHNVAVELDGMGNPLLAPSCTSTLGEASPTVRLTEFAESFPSRNQFASICQSDFQQPLFATATAVSETANQSPCLHGPIADVDAEAPGLQSNCIVSEVVHTVAAAPTSTELPACSGGDATPCYTIAGATSCTGTETGLAVSVSGTVTGNIVVECAVDPVLAP